MRSRGSTRPAAGVQTVANRSWPSTQAKGPTWPLASSWLMACTMLLTMPSPRVPPAPGALPTKFIELPAGTRVSAVSRPGWGCPPLTVKIGGRLPVPATGGWPRSA